MEEYPGIENFDKNIETIFDSLLRIQSQVMSYQKYFVSRSKEFYALELCGEVGELANIEKKAWKGRKISEEHLAEETADVFIALVNYCDARGINLAEAVKSKMLVIADRWVEKKKNGEEY